MKFFQTSKTCHIGLALSLSALLVACGGGGSSSSSGSTSTTAATGSVSSTNYTKLGSAAAAASADLNSTQNIYQKAGSKGVSANVSEALPAFVSSTYMAGRVIALAQQGGTTKSASLSKATGGVCSTGTVTFDPDPTTSASSPTSSPATSGGTQTVTFANCQFDANSPKLNGSVKTTFGSASSGSSTMSMTIEYVEFSAKQSTSDTEEFYFNGKLTMTAPAPTSGGSPTSSGAGTFTMKYENFTVKRNGESHTYNFTAEMTMPAEANGEPTMKISQDIVVDGKTYTVSTEQSLKMPGSGASHPTSGEMKITGAGTDYTTVKLDAQTVNMDLHAGGVATPTASASSPWTTVLNKPQAAQ